MVDKLNGPNTASNYPIHDRIDLKQTEKPKDSTSLFTKARQHLDVNKNDNKIYSGSEVDWYLSDKTGVINYEETPDGTITTPRGSHPSDLPQEVIDKENAKYENSFPTGKMVNIDGIPQEIDQGKVEYGGTNHWEGGMVDYIGAKHFDSGMVDYSTQIDVE